MIGYDFGMHRAGVLLLLLLLAAPISWRSVMGVLCDHRVSHRQRKCARDYS